jgi:hypothetical protein
MRTADMVKSKFFRAIDMQGQRPLVLTIADVTEELLGRGTHQDVKCFLWFKEHPKGLQLNKGRVSVLELAYGPDSVLWTGKRVRLSFDPTVMFGGRAVGGVKLETPAGAVFTPGAEAYPGWGEVPAGAPGRPPAPVWDEKRQQWITPQPPPPSAAPAPSPAVPSRPPPPVWDDASQSWKTVDPGTGEIGGQMPAGRGLDQFNRPPPPGDFDDDIPF